MQSITKDIEIKNKLTVTRGEIMRGWGKGEKGEGFSGATIKNTWTQPKGVESGEGGGNG